MTSIRMRAASPRNGWFPLLPCSAALLAVALPAQCPEGADAGLVKWNSSDGYASTFPVDDEGISPLITLPFFFPMPVPLGPPISYGQMWISSNGELYLANGAPPAPGGGSAAGCDTAAEIQGPVGADPRIVAFGCNLMASQVSCSTWEVSVDGLAFGSTAVTVTWTDVARVGSPSDRFSFSCTLHSTGSVDFSYGPTAPAAAVCGVGISTGNGILGGAVNLNATPTSTNGLIYEVFPSLPSPTFDLAGQTLHIAMSGTTKYAAAATTSYTPPDCAYHCASGVGCYQGDNTIYDLFVNAAAASGALTSTRLTFTRHSDFPEGGYTATFFGIGGTPYLSPTRFGSTATSLNGSFVTPGTSTPDLDDGVASFTTPPIPIAGCPGDTNSTWIVSINGILTADPAGTGIGNNDGDFTPTAAEIEDATVAPQLAFYSWHDFLLNDTPPTVNGTIYWELSGGYLYVTWDAVEAWPRVTINPSTFQFQIDTLSGDVTIVWQGLEAFSASNWLVGCTLEGAGNSPGLVPLDNTFPLTGVTLYDMQPLTLSAAPRPVQSSSNTLNYIYTIENVPEFLPSSGIFVYGLFFGFSFIPGGFNLNLIGAPSCFAYANPDIMLSAVVVGSGTCSLETMTQPFTPSGLPLPPYDYYAQAFAVFAVPNATYTSVFGNSSGILTSNVVHSHVEYQ